MSLPRIGSRYLAALVALVLLCLAVPAPAREVRVGIGFVLPPYVVREDDSGLEVEIIRRALAEAGHTAVFVYLPNLRLPLELARGTLDAVAANRAYDLAREMGGPAHPSGLTVEYRNCAVSRRSDGFVIHAVGDLRGKRVLTFQNARKYLGQEFRRVADSLQHYRELADQSLHVGMLYAGRTDVVISDRRIFLYWRKRLADSSRGRGVDLEQPLVFHDIFSPSPRTVFFSDPALRDAFDQGLEALRGRGEIEALNARHLYLETLPR
ncbi:MAG: transporter substrate-binding domain-containing protein [Pseudodesulfovibrio sp.]